MDIFGTPKMVFILVTLFAVRASDVYLLRKPTFDNLRFSGYTLESLVNIRTLPSCAFRCGINTACVSLFYNRVSKSCILKSVLFRKSQDGVFESGNKYYTIFEDGCPKDFVRNRKHDLCYKSFASPVDDVTSARSACTSNGYVLVRLRTLAAFNHISNELLVSPGNDRGFYIGGSDEITEGRWIFDNGEVMTAFVWGDGEPDNDPTGDYVYLRLRNGKYEMSDTLPNLNANYICQKL